MAKVLVLYKTPKSTEAFDKHYAAVHIPLAKKIPGLKKYDVSTGPVRTPAGPSGIHLVATLYFDSLDALKAGMSSAEGKAAAAISPTLPMAAWISNLRREGSVRASTMLCDDCVAAREGRLPRLEAADRCTSRADRLDRLFARGAGVHVDFHAHRHFDNLRSFPGHSSSRLHQGLPSSLARIRAGAEPRATSDLAQVWTSRVERRYFAFGQSISLLDKIRLDRLARSSSRSGAERSRGRFVFFPLFNSHCRRSALMGCSATEGLACICRCAS